MTDMYHPSIGVYEATDDKTCMLYEYLSFLGIVFLIDWNWREKLNFVETQTYVSTVPKLSQIYLKNPSKKNNSSFFVCISVHTRQRDRHTPKVAVSVYVRYFNADVARRGCK